MCGVLVAFAKEGQLNEKDCLRASEKIFSRGPDFNFSRFKLSNRLFLSQTVLSITGEVTKSRKLTSSRRYSISFNGEIYNYKQLNNDYLKLKKLIKYQTQMYC